MSKISLKTIQKLQPKSKEPSPEKIGPIKEEESPPTVEEAIQNKLKHFLFNKNIGIEKVRQDAVSPCKKEQDEHDHAPHNFSYTLIERLSKHDKVLAMFERDRFKDIQHLLTRHSVEDQNEKCRHV